MLENNIGKLMYPVDNSYSIDLLTGEYPKVNNGHGLAGGYKQPAVQVKIITNSFKMIKAPWGGYEGVEFDFCIVEYNNRKYLILDNFKEEQPYPPNVSILDEDDSHLLDD